MQIIKKGISDDKFIGKCHTCTCVVLCTRKELAKEGKSSFPLYEKDEIPDCILIECPECGSTRLAVHSYDSKTGIELFNKYSLKK